MSFTEPHTSSVTHGSTREVYDGSCTVCVQADVVTGRHNTSYSWDDVMDPPKQPRPRELQQDNRSGWIYQLNDDGLSDDDDNATLEDSDLDIEEQQSAVVATTVKYRREYSKGYKPPTSSTPGDGQCSDDISEAQVRQLINSLR